ncbi:hypothetical protein HYALB_00004368 [Hymenoscyphus albidus]|uniref:Uncharacterized protein n=1 Tax=Hymenoscyphus albidus TaxID=595503 RepID=A0A9N9LL86_9HELO|nr:hypothetical protein HYALB_00004368 [Hymenoscyphus albidus]
MKGQGQTYVFNIRLPAVKPLNIPWIESAYMAGLEADMDFQDAFLFATLQEGQNGEPDGDTPRALLPPLPVAPVREVAGDAMGYDAVGASASLTGESVPEMGGGVKPLDSTLPSVVDAESLANAVKANPQRVFTALTNIAWARDDAEAALAGMATTCNDLELARAQIAGLDSQLDQLHLEYSEVKDDLRAEKGNLRLAEENAQHAIDDLDGMKKDMAAQKQAFERLDWGMKTKNKMLFKIINYYEHHIVALCLDRTYSVLTTHLPQTAMIKSIDPAAQEALQDPFPLFPPGTKSYTDDNDGAAAGSKGKGKEGGIPITPPPTYAQAATSTKGKKGKKGKNPGSSASSVSGGNDLAASTSSLPARPGSAANFNPGAQSFVPTSSSPKPVPAAIASSSKSAPFAYSSNTVPPIPGVGALDLVPTERPNLCYTIPPPMPHPGHPYSGVALIGQSVFEASRIDEDTIKFLISSLPESVRNICPISITCSSSICTVPGCKLQKVCDEFNNETLPLTHTCLIQPCPFVHMYRTCEQEINGAGLGCQAWMDVQKARAGNLTQGHSHAHPPMSHASSARQAAGGDRLTERRDMHVAKRAHAAICTAEENEARRLLFQIIDVHRLGRYLG